MDIPNLNQPKTVSYSSPASSSFSKPVLVIVIILALSMGFWGSRLFPMGNKSSGGQNPNSLAINPETITNKDQLEVNKVYGNLSQVFKDTATGIIEKGSINGEGTHILNRPGGLSQRASLTSSVIDLDLFIGKNVEVKGETNASTKTSWLLDVGTIKIVE